MFKPKTLDKIWLYIRQHPGCTVGEVAKATEISYNTAKKYIAHMYDHHTNMHYTETLHRNSVTSRKFFIMDQSRG